MVVLVHAVSGTVGSSSAALGVFVGAVGGGVGGLVGVIGNAFRGWVGMRGGGAGVSCGTVVGSGVNGDGTGGNWFDDGGLDDDRYGNGATVIGPVAVGLTVASCDSSGPGCGGTSRSGGQSCCEG